MREKATAEAPAEDIHAQLARALPTPVRRISPIRPTADTSPARSSRAAGIWLKDDGLTASLYGGNKVRKLAPLLEAARSRGARRIVTFGAAGSHHVLATTLYARQLGMRTLAWLGPQPRTTHVQEVLRASIGAGLEAIAVDDLRSAALGVSRLSRGDFWIGPGGMGALGASGYFDAALELARQVGLGELPPPDWIVVATGSGSTAAGLLAGLFSTPLRARLLGVLAAANPAIRPIVLAQAKATAALRRAPFRWAEASARIDFDDALVGAGYGHPMRTSETTRAHLQSSGLLLDPTYTEKALSRAMELAQALPGARVLYWHTLSSVPLAPLLASAPTLEELPRELLRLMIRGKTDRGA